jgi:hypothetical protein
MNVKNRDLASYYAGDTVTVVPVIQDGYLYSHPNWVGYTTPMFYTTLLEYMTPNSNGSRKQWKDFEHYKAFRGQPTVSPGAINYSVRTYEFEPRLYAGSVNSERFGVVGYTSNGAVVHPFGEPGLPILGLPEYYSVRSDGGFVPPPDILEALKQKSLNTMMPSIKSELSVVNSIYELKDFESLPRTLKRIYSFFASFAKRGLTLKKLLRSTGQTGSDSYLQAQFNVLPLLSDIVGIHTALLSIEQKIRQLVNRAGTVQTRHFRWAWTEYDDINDSSSGHHVFQNGIEIPNAWIPYTGMLLERKVVNSPSIFHAEMQYNYYYTDGQLEHAQVLGFLDAIGANLNPTIIWNAIPWSFVVDWVIGVGRWLDTHKTLNMEPRLHIRRYLWSVTRERSIYTTKRSFGLGPITASTGRSISLPAVTEKSYRRFNDLPSANSVKLSGLSLIEFSLGGALVISRLTGPSKRHFRRK